MKRVVTFLALTINIISSVAQKAEVDEGLDDENYISLPVPRKSIVSGIHFTSISVFDERFDTLTLGFAQDIQKNRGELRVKRGIAFNSQKFYKETLGIDSGTTNGIKLIAYIKKVFLSDFIYAEMPEDVRTNLKKWDRTQFSGVIAEIEFFACENENYYPLYRFDSTIIGIKNIKTEGGLYIADALTASLKKLGSFNWETIKADRKVIAEKLLKERYKTRMDISILTQQPLTGVYFSFEDFKMNKPVISEFKFEKKAKRNFLYVKSKKGEDSLCQAFWGFFDGSSFYIYITGNFYMLNKQRNSFCFFGIKDFRLKRTDLDLSFLNLIPPYSPNSKYRNNISFDPVKAYFLLDMDSGDLY